MPTHHPAHHEPRRRTHPLSRSATIPTEAPSFREDHIPHHWDLRRIKRIQQRMEAGFWDRDSDNDWIVDTEVQLGSREYQRLLNWYLRRKPYFQHSAVDAYCALLTRHMKGKTITAHVSIDPEDGWLCLWFTVYGLPQLRRATAIHDEHIAFLDALFSKGLHTRHTSGHIGLMIAPAGARPTR